MNIFKKISLVSKIIKVVDLIKELNVINEIKDGVELIQQGVNKISEKLPEVKDVWDELKLTK